MVVWQSLLALGVKVEVLPLLDTSTLDDADEELFMKEAEICEADPESHIAIDYDEWQCETCHGGYPTLEEYREARKQDVQIDLIGKEVHAFRIGQATDKDDRLNIQGGIDVREWQRSFVEKVIHAAP